MYPRGSTSGVASILYASVAQKSSEKRGRIERELTTYGFSQPSKRFHAKNHELSMREFVVVRETDLHQPLTPLYPHAPLLMSRCCVRERGHRNGWGRGSACMYCLLPVLGFVAKRPFLSLVSSLSSLFGNVNVSRERAEYARGVRERAFLPDRCRDATGICRRLLVFPSTPAVFRLQIKPA